MEPCQKKAVELLRVGLHQELISASAIEIGTREKTPLAKTVRTCRKLLKVEEALWTFVYHNAVEPTNNSAEQALRPAVIWRGLSFGSQSQVGSEFVARMLTVNHSLKLQGRSILDFLTESCAAEIDQNFVSRTSEAPQIRTLEPDLHKKLNILLNFKDLQNI